MFKLKTDDTEIGKNIKKLRKEKKLTQKQLGSLIGKTESSIQKYESGVTEIPRSVLEKIAAVLCVHVIDILDNNGQFNWDEERCQAVDFFINSIGCEIEYDAIDSDTSLMHYKGRSYAVTTSDIWGIYDDTEDAVTNAIEKLAQKENEYHPTK